MSRRNEERGEFLYTSCPVEVFVPTSDLLGMNFLRVTPGVSSVSISLLNHKILQTT